VSLTNRVPEISSRSDGSPLIVSLPVIVGVALEASAQLTAVDCAQTGVGIDHVTIVANHSQGIWLVPAIVRPLKGSPRTALSACDSNPLSWRFCRAIFRRSTPKVAGDSKLLRPPHPQPFSPAEPGEKGAGQARRMASDGASPDPFPIVLSASGAPNRLRNPTYPATSQPPPVIVAAFD